MAFQPLRRHLHKRIIKYSFSKDIRAQEVLDVFDKKIKSVLGEVGAQAVAFRKGTLTVRAPNSAVVQEMKLRESELLQDLKRLRIQRVIYRV